MKLTATVHYVGKEQQVTETFKKRELIGIVDPSSKYPAYLKFEAINDKTSIFDGLNPGDVVEISYDLNGRLATDRKTGEPTVFNQLKAWEVSVEGQAKAQEQGSPLPPPPPADF